MATEVVGADDMREPIIRGKKVSVSNDGSMLAIADYEFVGEGSSDHASFSVANAGDVGMKRLSG